MESLSQFSLTFLLLFIFVNDYLFFFFRVSVNQNKHLNPELPTKTTNRFR